MRNTQWQRDLQKLTERLLTWRKRRKLIRKEKQRRKNPILDWTEVILSAALIVLVINQYLFQAYQIPSESMVPTLRIGDRIFVDKLVYGPELVPGRFKLPGLRDPRRAEVVIFENPTYISKGPLFDIVNRVLYMLTFTLVDIDRDAEGNVAVHFLIKRAVGVGGDRIRVRLGEAEFRLPGETEWISEAELKDRLQLDYPVQRIFPGEAYGPLRTFALGVAREDAGVRARLDMEEASSRLARYRFRDQFYFEKVWNGERYRISPHSNRYGREWRKREMGWHLAPDTVFPMGDNRDNSRDARYFNAVREKNVLGRATVRFWPLPRIGGVD